MESLNQAWIVVRDSHAAPAAARRGLDDDRILEGVCFLERLLLGIDDAMAAGGYGNSRLAHGFSGVGLVSHRPHLFRPGADECDITTFADFGKMCIFREEAVSRMDRIHIADLAYADDPLD